MPDLLNADFIGGWVAFVLSLMVFSYLLGDNPLFRLATHLFVGVSVGYAVVIAWHNVLWPRLLAPLAQDPLGNWLYWLPLLLGVLLLARVRPGWSTLGNLPLGYLFGVGAAVSIGGALLGTLFPQVQASMVSLNPQSYGGSWAGVVDGLVLAFGVIGTLFYFHFSANRGEGRDGFWAAVQRLWLSFGRWALMIAFGALFAGAILSRLSLLIARLEFLWSQVQSVFL
ncbi:MAG: hypothetical protein GX605_02705 [Chloroflexi bacterium]|nr:hypothetical protein [Chloroflexota bacterium]